MATCKVTTTSGAPCKMPALKGKDVCFSHDPESRAAQAEARKRGGHNRGTPHAGDVSKVIGSPRTIEESYSILDYVLTETLAMENGIQRNRLLVAIAEAYMDPRKISELGKLVAIMRPQIIEIVKHE